jgi:hypothetical protein
MEFTDPFSLLLKFKAKDDDLVYYCPRSAFKSFTLKHINDDVFELDVPVQDLIVFLKVFNGDIFEEVKKLTVAEQQHLIHVSQLCGISREECQFDSFSVLSDAIFDGDPIVWDIWNVVAKYFDLDMQSPDDAIKLLDKRGLCCLLEMDLKDAGVEVTKFNFDIEKLGYELLVKKFGPPKEKQELTK